MTYGLETGLFVENGPAALSASTRARRSTDGFRAWRRLDRERRLAAIESALSRPANDNGPDGFPLAL